MLAAAVIAVIAEAAGQPLGQAEALVDGLQQQGVAIAGHAAAVKVLRSSSWRALGGGPVWRDRL